MKTYLLQYDNIRIDFLNDVFDAFWITKTCIYIKQQRPQRTRSGKLSRLTTEVQGKNNAEIDARKGDEYGRGLAAARQQEDQAEKT